MSHNASQRPARYAFVIMPLNNAELDAWFLGPLQSQMRAVGLPCLRADGALLSMSGLSMLDAIHDLILHAEVVIAELTDANRNVLYELGFAQAAGKDPIAVAADRAHIPSDLAGVFTYGRDDVMAAVHSRLASRAMGALSDFILPSDPGPIYVLAGPKIPPPRRSAEQENLWRLRRTEEDSGPDLPFVRRQPGV